MATITNLASMMRLWINEKGVEQQEIAQHVNISTASLSRFLNGKLSLDQKHTIDLVKFLFQPELNPNKKD